MRLKRTLTAFASACALASASPAAAQEIVPQFAPPAPAADAGPVDETPDLWFVELASPPTADGTSLTTVRSEKAAFRLAAKKAGVKYTERYAFDTLFNGLSIRASAAELAKVKRLAGVAKVYPVHAIAMPKVSVSNDPELFTAIEMTGAKAVQESGFTGAGVKVGVIDTGVDYDHPDLGGTGTPVFPTARVVAGFDFVGDDFNADSTSPTYNPVTTPDDYPDDCAGHGTHVAGIIGANAAGAVGPNGSVTGVAPGVSFGAYRVFGCEGSTTGDVMIAAMERALADGMQVVNMSIGAAFQWPQYPTAVAATRLVNRGVVVVASIGNSGTAGLWAAGAPGVGDKVIGVASFDNTHAVQPYFTASPDDRAFGYNVATAAPMPPTTGTYPLSRTGTPATANDACDPLTAGSLTGTVALIRRGTCSFYIKAANAQAAGAVAVILYNNAAGALAPTVAGSPPVTIPVVAVTQDDGAVLNGRIAAGTASITWTDQLGSFPQATANTISSFSSYGLTPDLQVKPDLGAPGGSIWSTYPLELGGYANLSGTSMASPHVAGAVALLLEAKPRTPAQAVASILQNTAQPKAWWGNPALGFLDNVGRQGAGMLRINDAITATTKVTPSKLALGESEAGAVTRTLTIENSSSEAVTYGFAHVRALAVSNTFTPAFNTAGATATFSAPTVTVPARGAATVDVTITPPAAPSKGQYGGYIEVTPTAGGKTYRVPYAGFVGDYQAIQVLAPTPNGFPWLAKFTGTSYGKQSAGATFTMAGADIPFFLLHLDHPSRSIRVEIFDAKSGKSWHTASLDQYLPRNSTATGFFAFAFDGTTYAGARLYTVPNGSYVAKISVLKALGDAANPSHWETWTSPAFTVAR